MEILQPPWGLKEGEPEFLRCAQEALQMIALVGEILLSGKCSSPVALLNRHIVLLREGLPSTSIVQIRKCRVLPRKARAHVQPIHVLADKESEKAHTLQLHERHVGQCGPCTLEGSVELGSQAPLLHRPDAMGASEGGMWGEMQTKSLGIRERGEHKKRQTAWPVLLSG